MKCSHSNTKIWEPHLAGAKKCLDCGMVYNPNHKPSWFFEHHLAQYSTDQLIALVESAEDRLLTFSLGLLKILNDHSISQTEALCRIREKVERVWGTR